MNIATADFQGGPAGLPPHPGENATVKRTGLPPALLQYWQTVKRWRWIIAGIIVGCLFLGLIITLLLPPQYTARAQLEISREQKQITNVQGLESNESGRDLEFYATQYALLAARPVIERVARRLNLVNDAAFFEAHGLDPEDLEGDGSALTGKERQQLKERLVVDTLLDNVTIDPVRTSRLVDISYTSRSPELSTRITNAWTEAFVKTNMDRQFASTADARRFLEERLANLRSRVEQTEREVITYASDKGIITLDQSRDEEGKTVPTRTLAATDLEALNAALNSAVSARILAESRLSAQGGVTGEAVSNAGLGTLRQKRAELAGEYAKLMVQFEPGYPGARAIQQELRAIDAAISRETDRITSSRRQEYNETLARESELRAQVTALKERLDRQQRASIQYAVLQREADTNRQLYDALLQRYKEIGVAGAVGASNISVVEQAQVPMEPSSPSIPLNLALSLLAGIMIAAGTAMALEHIDEGVRYPAQVQPLLGLPLLGHTPLVEDDPVELLADTKSHYYDANFTIHSNLAFTTSHGFPKSMTVASTQPNEGKSSTALALAVILGRMGKRLLLVDADMRSPSVHTMVGRENERGFSNYLAGDDDWRQLVQSTGFKGVDILSAGPIPPSAAELLSGERLYHFIQDSLGGYDHVIFDSPPVLGLTDAPQLSRAVEGCVFVTQAGGAPLRAIRSSIERLQMAKTHIFGVVMTKVKHEQSEYGYGYGMEYGKTANSAETA